MRDIENSKIYFRDFTDAPESKIELHTSTAISYQNFDPPSYLVGVVLFKVMEFTKHRETEKIHWYAKFRYKEHEFIIHDYKFGTWTIRAGNADLKDNEEKIKKLIGEIHTKVSKSSKYYNKILAELLTDQIDKGEVFFNNVHNRLTRVFDFFDEKINEAIQKRETAQVEVKKEKTPIGEATTFIDHKRVVEMEIEYYAFAQMNSFFSILEFLLDCFFAFKQPNLAFKDFQKLNWTEKFKIVCDLQNGTLKQLYDDIVFIKEEYRNPLSHGLNNEVNFLVKLEGEGLIPINYEFLTDKPNFSLMTIPFSKCLFIQKTFKETIQFFSKETPYKYYMDFVSNDFSIPLEKSLIDEIKTNMTSEDNWKKYIDERIYWRELSMNRDD